MRWVAAAGAVVIAAAVVAFFVLRGGDDDGPKSDLASEHGGNGLVTSGKAVAPAPRPAKRPDDDVKGTLRLEGQVIDEQQQPVGGATVLLAPGDRRVATAADGSFAFDDLAARRYRLSASKDDGYAPYVNVRLSATSEPAILRMRRGATIIVHVTDEHGPLASASGQLDRAPAVHVDAGGVVTFRGVGDFFHYVEVKADGYAPATFSVTLARDPGATIDKTLVLHRGAAVAGVVLDPAGNPLADAGVTIAQGRTSRTTVKTDASGKWRVDALAAGKYAASATSEIYGPADDITLELDGVTPKRDVILHVAVDAQLVGTVVDATDHPVAGATVVFGTAMSGSTTHTTDAAGHFEVLGFPAGEREVYAREGRRASPVATLNIKDDERAEVRLVLEDSGIAGTVVDARGEPVAEARVRAMGGKISIALGGDDVTDAHGRFDLGAMPPGDYDVSATWPEQDDHPLRGHKVHTGTTDAKIVLADVATLTAHVTLDGAPVSYFGVVVSDMPDNPFLGYPQGIVAPDGKLVLHGVDPKPASVVFIAPGTKRKIIRDVAIAAGKTTDLGEVALEHGQRIHGHVRDASGALVEGATVSIGVAGPELHDEGVQKLFRGGYTTTTDADGAYMFDGIAPIPREKLEATHPIRGASASYDLPAGDATLDLVLASAGAIDGMVEGFSDRFGGITARGSGAATPRLAQLDGSGAFHFENLVPGDYTLSMTPMPGKVAPPAVKVTVVANERVTARLVIAKNTVPLVVKVVGAPCDYVMLVTGGDAPTGADSMLGMQRCESDAATFQVAPGSYRACHDKTCVPVTVGTSPASVELKP